MMAMMDPVLQPKAAKACFHSFALSYIFLNPAKPHGLCQFRS